MIIAVTHSPILLGACDFVVALDKGRIALAGPAKEILPRLLGRRQPAATDRPAADGKKHHGSNKKHGSEKRAEEVFSVECFLVSRGWQLDQSRLLRALDGVQCANFARVQVTKMIIIGFSFGC